MTLILDETSYEADANAQLLARMVGEKLHKHYPGHLWKINVNVQGGTLEVRNLLLSGEWGYVIHLSKLDPDLKKVVMAGGELLERYRVSRGRFVEGSTRDLRRDVFGQILADT